MRQIQTVICILFLFIASQTPADELSSIQFEHLSMQHGISHNLIYCLMQDQKGFLWIGTMYGLVRYDGLRYIVFRHDPADSTSLSHNDIVSLYEDDQEEIWIGTWGGGLNRLDRQRRTFTRYLHDADDQETSIGARTVWNIIQTTSGTQRSIWLATQGGGVSRMILEGDQLLTVKHYRSTPDKPDGLDHNFIRTLLLDKSGDIWIGAVGGLYQLPRHDNYGGPIIRYPLMEKETGKGRPMSVLSLLQNQNGDFWIGTGSRGVAHLPKAVRGEREPATFYTHNPEDPASIAGNGIQSLLLDKQDQLWIGTEDGLSILQPNDKGEVAFRNFQHEPDDPMSLSGNSVIALCEDASGTIFAATYYGGLDKFTRGKDKFQRLTYSSAGPAASLPARDVSAVAVDEQNTVWLATRNGGLSEVQDPGKATQKLRHLRHNPDEHTGIPGSITSILPTRDTPWAKGEQLLIGSLDKGLAVYQPNDRSLHPIELPMPARVRAPVVPITKLHRDKDILWIGSQYGLYRYDMSADSLMRYMPNAGKEDALPHYWITSIYKDRDGQTWIGSYGGLSKWDPIGAGFVNHTHDINDPRTISNNYVYAMAEDHNGRFWIGTSGGLNLMNPLDNTFQSFHIANGLPNEVICGILVDATNQLWLSTHRGLFRVVVDESAAAIRLNIHPYDIADGLQSNVFNPGVFARDDHVFLFGGINGLNFFDPRTIRQRKFQPPISVNMVFPRQSLQIGARETLEFNQQPEALAFEFASLDYAAPEKNQFAYRLSNQSPQWIESGNTAGATFTNLPAGEYTLEVKGSNSDLQWSDEVASVNFIIHPPFWKTNTFYFLISLSLIGLILALHYYQVRLKIRQSLLIERARIKERDKIREKTAQDYHDELGHQLTKISLYSELVKRDIKTWQHEGLLAGAVATTEQRESSGRPEHIFGYLEKITSASQSLCLSARDFIWTLNPENDSLFDVGNHLQFFGEDLFEEMAIDFQIDGLDVDFHATRLSMDQRRHIVLLFKEAMNNAARHSGATKVNLLIEKLDDESISIHLRDNGTGIYENHREGSGLANMRKRAAKIDAPFQINSMPGFGTEVQLRFAIDPNLQNRESQHV